MELFAGFVGLFVVLLWVWFATTLNGIHKHLKEQTELAHKQIEFLDYISDQLADSTTVKSQRSTKD